MKHKLIMKNQKYTICYKKHGTRSWDRVVISTHKSAVSIINKMIESYQFSDIKVFDEHNSCVKDCRKLVDISSIQSNFCFANDWTVHIPRGNC